MKAGRNDPCLCGSGKKYKKCCLERDEAAARTASPARAPGPPPFDADAGPPRSPVRRALARHPYTIAKVVDRGGRGTLDPDSSVSAVARLSTEAIEERLGDLGVDPSREVFLALAARHTSAWKLSLDWHERVGEKLRGRTEDFLALAACELWKRWSPGRPSVEMLDDWMQEGYAREAERREREACDLWWNVWEFLRARFRPEMRTTADAEEVFAGTQSLFNWTQDFSVALHNATLDDAGYAEIGARYLREVIDQFPGEDELYRTNARADLGDLLFIGGRREEGEQVLRELIRDFPQKAIGYTFLADAIGRHGAGEKCERVARALAILEEAARRPVRDAADFDLDARIADLKATLAERGVERSA